MGNFTSRLFYHGDHDKSKQFNSSSLVLENHDTCTPQPQKKRSVDPRSATLGIVRTPIEIIATPSNETKNVISAIPKYLQAKRYLETNFDITPTSATLEQCIDPRSPNVDVPRTPILVETLSQGVTPKFIRSNVRSKNLMLSEIHQKILGRDPRSPAFNFDRTPILKLKSLENAKARSQENLNTSTYDIKMPPSRLSFSEITPYLDAAEINTLPNIVTSFNNSQAPSNSPDSSYSSSIEIISDNSAITVLSYGKEDSLHSYTDTSSSNSPPESPKAEGRTDNLEKKFLADSENIIDNVLLNAMKDFEVKFNEAENKIKIWRDALSPVKQVDSEYNADSDSEDRMKFTSPKEEVIIEFDDGDCNLLGTIKKQEIQKKQKNKSEENKKRRIVKKEIEGKKLFSPSKKQTTEVKNFDVLKIRTPLRNRSNSNSKLQGVGLKSPHLQSKAPLTMKKHQENTPPNGNKDALESKLNSTKWDGDSTVII